MPTTASSLIARVREFLGDYGDGVTTLTEALTAVAGTVKVANAGSPFSPNSWVVVDNESMRILTADSASYTITMLRGQRGTTAATHDSGDVVTIGQIYSPVRILQALNEAIGSAYPKLYKLVADDTLAIIDAQYDYTLPTAYSRVVRVEMENTDEGGQFNAIRSWDLKDANTLRLYGNYSVGRNIRIIGTTDFDALTIDGNMDAGYPEDQNALDYLIYRAAASLLLQRQIEIGRRDSFIGMTDSFGENQPNTTLIAYREANTMADKCLAKAAARMPALDETLPLPLRRYYARV